MTECEHAARNVQQYYFAVIDASLFLDSHPEDASALRYFQRMKQAYDQAVKVYEKHFGPLRITSADTNKWNWVEGPWPWEGAK